MENVGWTVHLFAIEVGARGYCAATTSSCLVRLGFPPKTKRALLNHLGSIASKASFCIWQARNDKSKIFDVVPCPEGITEPNVGMLVSGSPKLILPPSHVPYVASKASSSEERTHISKQVETPVEILQLVWNAPSILGNHLLLSIWVTLVILMLFCRHSVRPGRFGHLFHRQRTNRLLSGVFTLSSSS